MHTELAALGGDEFVGDAQPQACAFTGRIGRVRGLGKALENALLVLGGNTGAVVLHAYFHGLGVGGEGSAHGDAAGLGGVAHGVGEEVEQHPGGFLQVCPHGWRSAGRSTARVRCLGTNWS